MLLVARMDKQNIIYSYNGITFIDRKKVLTHATIWLNLIAEQLFSIKTLF
jgi:hypothetical protein